MTAILGISAFYHDSAAALVVDSEVVAAAQEERFTRRKHDAGFPAHSVAYCLREAGLTPAPSRLVRPPRVAASPCALECKLLQIIDLRGLDGTPSHRHVAFGQVVGIHIDDRYIKDGRLDTAAMGPIARCGYADYSVVDKVFAIARPPAV